jgi:uncharacterized membrane protein YhaH (DUF805 family)
MKRLLNSYPFKNPNFFSLVGRLNRAKYILTMLVVILICTPVAVVWPNVGYLLASLGLFFAGIKRCHDLNWSGGALIIMACVPPLGIVLLFKMGTVGTNKYGDDPLSKNKEIKQDLNTKTSPIQIAEAQDTIRTANTEQSV